MFIKTTARLSRSVSSNTNTQGRSILWILHKAHSNHWFLLGVGYFLRVIIQVNIYITTRFSSCVSFGSDTLMHPDIAWLLGIPQNLRSHKLPRIWFCPHFRNTNTHMLHLPFFVNVIHDRSDWLAYVSSLQMQMWINCATRRIRPCPICSSLFCQAISFFFYFSVTFPSIHYYIILSSFPFPSFYYHALSYRSLTCHAS